MPNMKMRVIMAAIAATIVVAVIILWFRDPMAVPDTGTRVEDRSVLPQESTPMSDPSETNVISFDPEPPPEAEFDAPGDSPETTPFILPAAEDSQPPMREGVPPINRDVFPEPTPGRTTQDRPPGVDASGRPLVIDQTETTIRRLATEIVRGSGPEAATHALTLLDADEEGVAIVGAAVAAEAMNWNSALFDKVAGHEDIAVPLYAMQALRDQGRDEWADVLHAMLRDRLQDTGKFSEIAKQRVLPGMAARALIDLSRDLEAEEQHMTVVSQVMRDESVDYGARMAALLELRNMMPFEDFRAVVRDEHERAKTEDTKVWKTGLERLSERLDGPVQVHTGQAVLISRDVEVMTARTYDAMYEDLALRLETMLRDESSRFGEGITEMLREELKQAREIPISSSESAALQRIETLLPHIEEADVTHLVPPPPPDS